VTQEGATAVASGTWYHAAVTYDGINVRLYVNGVEDANSPWAEAAMSVATAHSVFVGSYKSNARFFDGVLDDVRFYDSSLLTPEVDAIYHLTAGRYRRSIGTNTGTVYNAGNATVAAGSKTVTFAGGADLPANAGQGDVLTIGADTYHIFSKVSATEVTIHTPSANPHTTTAYTITRAYNTLQAWEDARGGAMTTEHRVEIGVAYNDGSFTTGLVIDGNTTDSVHNMTLTVAEGQRHDGAAGTGVVLDMLGDAVTIPMSLRDRYKTVEWFEVTNSAYTQGGFNIVGNAELSNLLVHDVGTVGIVIWTIIAGGDTATVRNCIIYDVDQAGIISMGSGSPVYTTIENCTISTNDGGLYGVFFNMDQTITCRNTICVNRLYDFMVAGTMTTNYFGYNMFGTWFSPTGWDPDDYDGNNQTPPADLEDLFYTLTAGIEYYNLEWDGHDAWDTGLDLSASFTLDIDGITRTDAWDIGADEAITGNDLLRCKVLTWHEIEPQ